MNQRIASGLGVLAAVALFHGCDDTTKSTTSTDQEGSTPVSFMVASDVHYLSPALMADTSSEDFRAYMASDRKMIVQSPALLHSFLDSVRAAKPDFLLLTGDLTKDGEKRSHQDLADSLATLRRAGIAVYVIPGNHDVRNPEAEDYRAGGSVKTENVTETEFASIYRDCGFGQAIARDSASLSYVARIGAGVRLLALDPTRWRDNVGSDKETVGGRFLPSTCAWIRAQLAEAGAAGDLVVGAMHHGIVEHFAGQATNPISADYVVAGADSLRRIFAGGGMRVVFTGHFHAQDIATVAVGSSSLTDVETGSLVTSPSPFRRGRIEGGTVSVSSGRIREIVPGVGGDFQAWSRGWLLSGMTSLSARMLQEDFGVDSVHASALAPAVALAYATHYAGDESMPASIAQTISSTRASGMEGASFLADALASLFTDPSPADSAGSFPAR